MTPSNPYPAPVALVEIGSNQVALVVGTYNPQQLPALRISHEASATLRLGGRLTPEGDLPASAWEVLAQQLRTWQPLWSCVPPRHRRVVCTQVLRDARNQGEWIQALHALLDCEVRIIDGQQEAAWGYAGAMLQATPASRHASHAPCLVLDIGGRSTEVSYGHGSEWVAGQSFAVGAVSWSQHFFGEGFSPAAFAQATAEAAAQLSPLQQPPWLQPWAHVYGVAGVAQALGHLLQQLVQPNHTVTTQALEMLQQQLCSQGLPWLLRQCQLPHGVAPMLGGCISTMQALMQTLRLAQLQVSAGGLRHGALQAHATTLSSEP